MSSKLTWLIPGCRRFGAGHRVRHRLRPGSPDQLLGPDATQGVAGSSVATVDPQAGNPRIATLNSLITAIAPLASLDFQVRYLVHGINGRYVVYPRDFVESVLSEMDAAITSAAILVSAGPRAGAVLKQCFVDIYQQFECIDFDATTNEDLVRRDPQWSDIRATAARAVARPEAIRQQVASTDDKHPAGVNVNDCKANPEEGHMGTEHNPQRFETGAGELAIWRGPDRAVHFQTTCGREQSVALSTDEARRAVSALVELIVAIEQDESNGF